jgi:hypothetical protein
MLPARLRAVPVPEQLAEEYLTHSPKDPLPPSVTVADCILRLTEEYVGAYLVGRRTLRAGAPHTVASERAAIRRSIETLRPYAGGWLTEETCNLIPLTLIDELENRERQLAREKRRYTNHEQVRLLCMKLGGDISQVSEAFGVPLDREEKRALVQFIDAALEHAAIAHPDFATNPRRLTELVFPD